MFKSMLIGKKLLFAFIFVTVIASAAGIISMFIVKDVDNQYSDALIHYGFSQGDIGIAMSSLANVRTSVYRVIGLADATQIDSAKEDMQKRTEAYTQSLENAGAALASDEELALFQSIQNKMPQFNEIAKKVIEIGQSTNPAYRKEAQDLAAAQLDPLYESIYQDFTNLFEKTSQTGTELSAHLTKKSNGSMVFTTVLVLGAMTISIVFGIFIASSISKPMMACAQRLRKLALGDLQSSVPKINTKDETGMLAQATETIVTGLKAIIEDESHLLEELGNGNFDVHTHAESQYVGDFAPLLIALRKIRLSLSETIANVNKVADQVSGGASQVADGSQALSQGAVQQAASVESFVSSINKIYQQTTVNAEYARKANQKVAEAGTSVDISNRRMQEMATAISEISDSSHQIAKIIKAIEDIAFQTNILALNASVEAARAGAAGKGFAVVAGEVRNLAKKSSEAAKNTAALIDTSYRAVANGTRIAGETANAMTEVVLLAGQVAEIVTLISDASATQTESLRQISAGIDHISSVVQTNSATAQQSAAASQELSGQSHVLKELVSQFKIADEIFSQQCPLPEMGVYPKVDFKAFPIPVLKATEYHIR